ncbi:MAG: c-type cytochrome biogenesis protein CcmI [Pseudomonadota bacterium]
MVFWIVASLTTLMVAALLAFAVLRRDEALDQALPARAPDVKVYRDQLAEIDRDVARGTLNPDEAERVRLEVSRRLLDADKAASDAAAPGHTPRAAAIAGVGLVVVILLAGVAFYGFVGEPGRPDLPLTARLDAAEQLRATRPSQAEAEASLAPVPERDLDPELATLMQRLRAAVAENPGDAEGLGFLAQNEARIGRWRAAYLAQARLITAKDSEATANDYALLASYLISAAGGQVTPEADIQIRNALSLDNANGLARYYQGLSYLQTERFDLTFRIWQRLLRDSTVQAPWVAGVTDAMPSIARRAGERWVAPEQAGPTLADIAAAEDMAPEDRMAMIQSMVTGLYDRLAMEGGPPQDWARLIRSLAILGNTEEAAAIWTEAQTAFADAPESLALLEAAARDAGLLE